MKRNASDWEEAFLRPPVPDGGEVEDGSSSQAVAAAAALEGLLLPRVAQKPRICGSGGDGDADPFVDVCAYFGFDFSDPDTIGSYSAGNQIWTQNLTGRHPSISATIESQSSICAGSPTSAHKPTGTENQAPGGTSDSDQSDDESMEIEQGTNVVVDLKRMRRMVSNRESARRSRRKKQAHLADLELQVDQLRGDNATLYKQLTDANQQFGSAVTDNRVLKSGVEALRVKVKMAEDLVTRGPLACGLDHLLENHIGSTQLLNARHLYRASEVLPIIEQQADDASYISASVGGQVQNIGMENSEIKNGNIMIRSNQNSPLQSNISMENLQNRVSGEVTGCGTDIWQWDSDANAMSKQI